MAETVRKTFPAKLRRSLLVLVPVIAVGVWLVAAAFMGDPGALGPGRNGVWDVIVVGSEPEGVAAAVAAAESGARTLLVTPDQRVGGLFVMGEMNSLDLRTQPFNYHQGLFERWWDAVGRRHSFDVDRAEAEFLNLLSAARVSVRFGTGPITPLVEDGEVTGLMVGVEEVRARHVVDATADMDFAAAAGASYTVGWESLGLQERMVDTLVFRIEGVDWQALRQGVRNRGPAYAATDNWAAWGHFGGYPAAYEAQEEGIRLRGLNLGLQEDGSILVNALLIYGIDPFDPASVQNGMERATREAPRMVEYLAAGVPGFENARYAGVASTLYIRESRHLEAECVLTGDDVLDNRVGSLDVAAGGYPLDVQTLTPHDHGYVFGFPEMFGVPLCVSVPLGLSNVWVAGKAAGYDPLAASSARVVPLGMTVAEAVGVAAARAARRGLTASELVNSEQELHALRAALERRGAYLPEVADRAPVGPHAHPHYRAYRLLLSRGLALGGYENEPRLNDPMQAVSFLNLLSNVAHRFYDDHTFGADMLARYRGVTGPLTLEFAMEATDLAARELLGVPAGELIDEVDRELVAASAVGGLTRGAMYELAAAIAERASPN